MINDSMAKTYKMKHCVGIGASALVRQAIHRETGEVHAVKIFGKAKGEWAHYKI